MTIKVAIKKTKSKCYLLIFRIFAEKIEEFWLLNRILFQQCDILHKYPINILTLLIAIFANA